LSPPSIPDRCSGIGVEVLDRGTTAVVSVVNTCFVLLRSNGFLLCQESALWTGLNVAITGNQFSVVLEGSAGGSYDSQTTVRGTFLSANQATGTIDYVPRGGTGGQPCSLTWSAQR
jgi:hypothetical protein